MAADKIKSNAQENFMHNVNEQENNYTKRIRVKQRNKSQRKKQ
jgi:hypothetical protein